MMDKMVVMCDFKGIKPGMLVRVHDGWHDLPISGGMMGVVIDRITYPRMVDEGAHELYDPMLIVVGPNGRKIVPVDVVTVVKEHGNDR